MFFSEKIKNILPTDRVLEIGPGADPHLRSNVLLEKKFENENEYISQFGKDQKINTDKQIIFYDGGRFPFNDKEFDYIICSHVLEHVPDVPCFLSEIFRVGSKGYLEYPLIYYEYLYNFDVHLNYLKFDGKCLHYMKKNKSHLDEFRPVQDFFFQSLKNGHTKMLDELIPFFMEGFEWNKEFEIEEVNKLEQVCHNDYTLPIAQPVRNTSASTMELLKELVKKSIGKK